MPLVATLTAANVHDLQQLIPLVVNIPPVRGKRGRPRRRPLKIIADKAYDCQAARALLKWLGIESYIPKRRTQPHGLGRLRWPIERTLSWLHQFRRLRIRYERRPDLHEAFLQLGCALICWNLLN